MRKGRYQQLTSYIKLRATLGDLSATDIDELDQCFVPSHAEATASLNPEHAPR
jgi:outer membrane protein